MNLTAKQTLTQQQLLMVSSEMNTKQKSKGIAYVMWAILGGFGAHRFYSGNTVYALCMLLFGWATLFIWPFLDVFFIGKAIERKNEELEMKIISTIKAVS